MDAQSLSEREIGRSTGQILQKNEIVYLGVEEKTVPEDRRFQPKERVKPTLR
jgi:hypothetical protein